MPLKKLIAHSPIVGVFGHRQVGKSTLITALPARQYYTLDLAAAQEQVEQDPVAFAALARDKPLTIDECQYVPALFPALKEHVRRLPKPGQFLLSGSVRFYSRKAIRESLTGRMLILELLPMSMAELEGRVLNQCVLKLMTGDLKSVVMGFSAHRGRKAVDFTHDLEKGGLPGVVFSRDASVRLQKFDSILDTILERDLRLLLQTTLSQTTLRQVLAELARRQGAPLDLSELMRATRVSLVTLKKLLLAFESLFLIRLLRTEGGRSRPVIFFEDQGEASFLAGHGHYSAAQDLLRLVYSETRHAFHYSKDPRYEYFQYRSRGGAEVPLAVRYVGRVMGFIALPGTEVTRQAMGSAQSFLRAYNGSRVLFVAGAKAKAVALSPQMALVPASVFL